MSDLENMIYNTTFVIDSSQLEEFLEWIKREVAEGLCPESLGCSRARLATVVDVIGAPDFSEQAMSVAFQVEFKEEKEARKWAMEKLENALSRFKSKFGQYSQTICSLLEVMDL